MITRPRLLLLGILASLLSLCFGIWVLWPRNTAITNESFDKIRRGMTQSEVEAILGGPARDETCGRAFFLETMSGSWSPKPPGLQWTSERCAISVSFREGRVYAKDSATVCNPDQTFFNRVCCWIGF
jgi:hypothetical protein